MKEVSLGVFKFTHFRVEERMNAYARIPYAAEFMEVERI
jgi:hypothetical protein